MSENPYSAPLADLSPSQPLIDLISQAVYPLDFRFKVVSFASQIQVTDAQGRPLFYIRQKLLKFKEQVQVFRDSSKTQTLAGIQANKVIDWSARYFFTLPDGSPLGSLGRKGMRSLWKATYHLFSGPDTTPDYQIAEENPWSKVGDALLSEIPILGFASSFCFHPRYVAKSPNGQAVFRLSKKPAFFEGKFTLEKLQALAPQDELNLVLAFLMLVLLEKNRG